LGYNSREGAVGSHAFEDKSGYQRAVENIPTIRLVREAGGPQRWNMPVAIWHSSTGYGEESEVDSLPNSCIAIVLSGIVECVKGGAPGRRSGCRSDMISLFRTGDPVLYVARDEFRCAHINFSDELWRDIATEALARPGEGAELAGDRVFESDREMRIMVDAYLARALDSEPPSALEMDSRANLMALALVRRHSSVSSKREVRAMSLAPRCLSRAKEYINAHLAADIGLAEIATAAGLSSFHFARAFKRETGVPPHRYLMEQRVERARELLTSRDMTLVEISLACGFAGQSHFTTAFKRHTGVTPGAWRAAVGG
jgi:AraC family transcriptional regulator